MAPRSKSQSMRRAPGTRGTPSRGNGTSELDLVWSGLKDDGALLSYLRACRRRERHLLDLAQRSLLGTSYCVRLCPVQSSRIWWVQLWVKSEEPSKRQYKRASIYIGGGPGEIRIYDLCLRRAGDSGFPVCSGAFSRSIVLEKARACAIIGQHGKRPAFSAKFCRVLTQCLPKRDATRRHPCPSSPSAS